MKKYFSSALLALALVGGFSSCEEQKVEPVTTVINISEANRTQEFGKTAETRFVEVTAEKLFDLKSTDESWCKVKRTGNGLRITGINIDVTENPRAAARQCEVLIWSKGTDTTRVQIRQTSADPVLTVDQEKVLVKGTLDFTVAVKANFGYKVSMPEWISQTGEPTAEGVHSFLCAALAEGSEPREGEIVFAAESLEGVTPVKVLVRQEVPVQKKLPVAPTFELKNAEWADLFFVKNGCVNAKTHADDIWSDRKNAWDRAELRTGAKTPASVWNDALKCYVADYPAATNDTYYAIMYDDKKSSETVKFDCEPTAIQGGFSWETYLRVSDVSQEYIRPFGNFDAKGNGQIGFGYQIINGNGQFTGSNMNCRFSHISTGKWNTEKFVHIVVVYNTKPNNTFQIYMDGKLMGESDPMGDWTSVSWDQIRGLGLGGNLVQPTNNVWKTEIRDGMVGQIAYFRWYQTPMTKDAVSARYAAVSTRAGLTKINALRKMVEDTLPAKSKGCSKELQVAIAEGITIGQKLMGDFATTDSMIATYLTYAQELLDFE